VTFNSALGYDKEDLDRKEISQDGGRLVSSSGPNLCYKPVSEKPFHMRSIIAFRKKILLITAKALICLSFLFSPPVLLPQAPASQDAYSRGTELVRAGSFEAALPEFRKAAELSPNNPKVYNMLGIVLTQLGRLQEANEAYGRALSVAPNFVAARKNRAVNSFTQGDFKFAAGEFEALAQLEPKDFVPRLFLGLLAIQNADFETAHKHLLEARQLAPGNGRVLVALARSCFGLGERKVALESAREMLSKARTTDAERFELAVVLAQFEANAEAAEIFQKLWQKKPGTYDVGFNLALTQYRSGQLEAALRTVEELSLHEAPRGELLSLRGWVYNKMRRLNKARESLEMAIAQEPENADHYLDLSTVLNSEGDTEAALQVILEGLQKDTQKDRLEVQMGLLYQKAGSYKEAEKCYQESLQSNPKNRSAYLALAGLMWSTGRQNETLDLLDNAVRFLPSDALLHYMYGGLLLESERDLSPERVEKSASLLKRALVLNPPYANTHYALGKLYLKKGEEEEARSSFEKACAFAPGHVGAHYQLSIIARRQGKKEKAEQLARTVQELEKLGKSRRESVTGVVQESLQVSPGGTLVSKGKN
jgi:Flp pilus assembly protein TadD